MNQEEREVSKAIDNTDHEDIEDLVKYSVVETNQFEMPSIMLSYSNRNDYNDSSDQCTFDRDWKNDMYENRYVPKTTMKDEGDLVTTTSYLLSAPSTPYPSPMLVTGLGPSSSTDFDGGTDTGLSNYNSPYSNLSWQPTPSPQSNQQQHLQEQENNGSQANQKHTDRLETTKVKRGRGRPAKEHSDVPDLDTIQHLSEDDRRKVIERAKNNEASRRSRRKNKDREQMLINEECELLQRNEQLKLRLAIVQAEQSKLMDLLKSRNIPLSN